ncbi:hypothetical protein DEU56DRAFT_919267 [Suillus clintonianus]|uniref:uncharacterized protein n=1 Tax=Suillus clintonianus TaxID=1904413 RepID=UPI001B8781B6|nr:uncharacterized protein DEU56DRAFT_919267 [Suillus clintonianus]KAG2116288.1 hypothetical protein DEU56DRAFT_919267 [Suillus clintonianus]
MMRRRPVPEPPRALFTPYSPSVSITLPQQKPLPAPALPPHITRAQYHTLPIFPPSRLLKVLRNSNVLSYALLDLQLNVTPAPDSGFDESTFSTASNVLHEIMTWSSLAGEIHFTLYFASNITSLKPVPRTPTLLGRLLCAEVLAPRFAQPNGLQGWEEIEATLHCIMSIQEAAPLEDNPFLARLFGPDVLGRLPTSGQERIRRTMLGLIGRSIVRDF